jgi:hypothetical protein
MCFLNNCEYASNVIWDGADHLPTQLTIRLSSGPRVKQKGVPMANTPDRPGPRLALHINTIINKVSDAKDERSIIHTWEYMDMVEEPMDQLEQLARWPLPLLQVALVE